MKKGFNERISDFLRSEFIFIILIIFSVSIATYKMYGFPFSLYKNLIFDTDGIFTQVQIQSLIDGAIFNKTNNLGFPFGYSQWTVPQFSIIESILLWVTAKIFSFTNFGFLVFIGVFTTILNSLSFYLLGKYYNLNSFVKILFLFIGAFSPFALNSLTHPHVMKIFTIPIYFIILKKLIERESFRKTEYLIICFFLLNSSLYWINVFFAIFTTLIFVLFLNKVFGRSDYNLNVSIKLFFTNFILLFIHFILFYLNRDISGDNGRGKWQSDIFSGKFTDFLLSSPFLNHFIGRTQNLYEGASTEIKSNLVGIPLAIGFFYLIYLIISYQKSENLEITLLKQISIISILFFLVGGLSNLQAAIFVLFDYASPMRTWSRISIVIATLGILLLFVWLKNLKKFELPIALSLIVFTFLDFLYLPRILGQSQDWKSHEYYSVVTFIEKNLSACPILQLPIDTYLVPQGALDKAYRYYWTDQIPYLVLPNFKWTAATYTGTAGWNKLTAIPSTLSDSDLKEFAVEFCAILFDKNFSQYQIDRKASLPNVDGGWPGVRIDTQVKPKFEDSRFRVYFLNEFKKY